MELCIYRHPTPRTSVTPESIAMQRVSVTVGWVHKCDFEDEACAFQAFLGRGMASTGMVIGSRP
jgi:hypothetical protein